VILESGGDGFGGSGCFAGGDFSRQTFVSGMIVQGWLRESTVAARVIVLKTQPPTRQTMTFEEVFINQTIRSLGENTAVSIEFRPDKEGSDESLPLKMVASRSVWISSIAGPPRLWWIC
jgi:hypothetical protein